MSSKGDSVNRKLSSLLIVDDEPEIVNMIAEYLTMSADYRIFKAHGGEEAEKILSQHKIDLVLSDVRMPYITGVDLLKKIRQRQGTEPIVVLFSGYTDHTQEELESLGVNAFLQKPVDLAHIEKTICENLNQVLAIK